MIVGRPLVLDTSLLFAPDGSLVHRAMVESLVAEAGRFDLVVRIDGRGARMVPAAALAQHMSRQTDITAVRAWLLGQGPRPEMPVPERPALRERLRWRRSALLPPRAVVVAPGVPSPRRRAALAPNAALLVLTSAPAATDWPEYDEAPDAAAHAERRAAFSGAAAIVAPDAQAAASIAEGFGVPMPHVIAPTLLPAPGAADPALAAMPFFLAIDRIEARANTALLLQIWRDLVGEGGSVPKLVLAGERGVQIEEVKPLLAWNEAIRAHVVEMPVLSRATLAHLAAHARGVLAPGFAQPDAALFRDVLAVGAPLVVADTPAVSLLSGVTRLSAIDGRGWRDAIRALAGRGARQAPAAIPPRGPSFVDAVVALAASLP